MIGVELCAGTAVVGLSALAGRPVQPITGYMGAKRRWAPDLSASVFPGGLSELVLVDAGPWGEVWSVLASGGARGVERYLRGLDAAGTLIDVWPRLVQQAPPDDPTARAGQYLALQARSASCIPIWWDAASARWVGPTGSRKQPAHPRSSGGRALGQANRRIKTGSGLIRIGTLADRVAALAALPWDRVTVVHGLVEAVSPIPGSRVYFDPPYQGCPRYAVETLRETVVDVARRHAAEARSVAVSEAEPLPLDGWTFWQLARREWITATGDVAQRGQLRLWQVPA